MRRLPCWFDCFFLRLSLIRNQKFVISVDQIRVADVVDLAENGDRGAIALGQNGEAVARLDRVDEAGAGISAAADFLDVVVLQGFKIFKHFNFLQILVT